MREVGWAMTPTLEIGKVYEVNHSRKGEFQMRVQSKDEVWVNGIVTNGRANAMLDYNVKHKGEQITLRIEHIRSAVEARK